MLLPKVVQVTAHVTLKGHVMRRFWPPQLLGENIAALIRMPPCLVITHPTRSPLPLLAAPSQKRQQYKMPATKPDAS